MKKYHNIIMLILFLVTVSSAMAIITPANVVHEWTCDNTLADTTGNFTLYNGLGITTFNSTNAKLGTHACNNSVGTHLVSNWHDYASGQQYTISIWFNRFTWQVGYGGAPFGINNTNAHFSAADFSLQDFPTPQTLWRNAEVVTTSAVNLNSWQQWIIVGTGTNMQFWLNGSNIYNSTTYPTDNENVIFGMVTQNAQNFEGLLDEIMILNRSATPDEIANQLWNNGNGWTTSSSMVNLSIVSTIPQNNTQFSTNNIPLTAFLSANTTFNCTLWLNDTYFYNWTNLNGSNTSISYNLIFPPAYNALVNYSFNCSNENKSVASPLKYFYIDNIFPVIGANFTNNSIWFKNNITGTFNLSDSFMLYSYNITIDGNEIASKITLNSTWLVYNLSYDPHLLTPGLHNLSVRLADGHTAEEIPEYDTKTGMFEDYLEYTFPDEKKLNIESKDSSIFDKWETEKTKDRYKFSFTPANPKLEEYTFVVTSDEEIFIVDGGDKYGYYLVTGEHWMDFVLPEYKDRKISISKTNPTEVEVTISGLKNVNKLDFNSIGDLNIITSNFSFKVINYSVSYVTEVVESQSHVSTLTINYTGTGLDNTNFSAAILYNGSVFNLTSITDISSYIIYSATLNAPTINNNVSDQVWFNWSVNISANPTEYILYNHTVFKINVNDCDKVNLSQNWTRALIFLFQDEEQNSSYFVNNTFFHIDLNVWYASESIFRNFSFDFKGSYNYSICIYPNSSSYKTNAIMEYFANGTANRKYYLDNFDLSNNTQILTLYHLNSSKASDIVFQVIDKNTGSNVAGAYIKILRYYPETGSYKTVEIERTDDNGYTLGKMVLADVFYKFIVETNRQVRLTTEVQRILALTKILTITQGQALLESWNKIGSVSTSVTCNNATLKCSFTWSDATNLVATGTLVVYRLNNFGNNMIFSQSLDSAAGTITYTITENTTGNSYTAYGYLHTNTANSLYDVGQAYMNFRGGIAKKFGSGAIIPVILLVIVMGAAFIDVGAVAVMVGSLVALIFAVALGFASVDMTVLISFVVICALIIAKLRSP